MHRTQRKNGKERQAGISPPPGKARRRESRAVAAGAAAAALLLGGVTIVASAARADVRVNNPAADTTAQDTQSGVSLIQFGSTLVAAFNDSGSFVGGADKFTGYARSTDGGVTWTDLGTLPTIPGGDAGYTALARHDASGIVYLTTLPFNGNGVQLFRSFDNGATFAAPINAAPGIGTPDKPHIAVDNFAGAGNGTVYVAARDFGVSQGIKLWRSVDGGNTFSPNGGTLIASPGGGNVNGAFVSVGINHDPFVFYFDETTATETIQVRRSTDFGLTFAAPVTVATLGTTTGFNGDLGLTGIRAGTATPAAFRSNAFPQAAVNPVTGHLYVVYADNPPGGDRADVRLTFSIDNGLTWSAPVTVNDTLTNDQWQPTLTITPDGSQLGVFWYDRRLDPLNNLIDYYGSILDVAGGTPTPIGSNIRISDVSFLPEFGRDPTVNSVYMGDYDFGADADNSFFYVAWGDNRDPSTGHAGNNANVYFDRIPVAAASNAAPEAGTLALLALGGLPLLAGVAVRRRSAHK